MLARVPLMSEQSADNTRRPTGRNFADSVYDYVAVPESLLAVVDDPHVQRLRRVSQTSLTSSVFPSATGSRFEHALGVQQLASSVWNEAWSKAPHPLRE